MNFWKCCAGKKRCEYMKIEIARVKQYNSTYKHIVMVDGVPVCITESGKRASECIQYLNGYNADINDGKIRKILDKYQMPLVNKDTEQMKKRKEKVIHKFSEHIA